MVEIGRTVISRDIFEQYFLCDLLKCRGACCIEGDSGAPVTAGEAVEIENEFQNYSGYLPENHIDEIKKSGFSVSDKDGDLVTPLVNERQCAYSFFDENGILKCAIEKAYFEGKSKFRKPVSCHLFPIRITEYRKFDALNYQELEICKAGVKCGKKAKLPLYQFLKEPLTRKYGEDWYHELELAAAYLQERGK